MLTGQSANAINYANQAQNIGAPKTVNPSCFGTIEDAARNVARLTDRLTGMVNRLAGGPPPTPDSTMASPLKNVPSGLLAEATDYATSISSNATTMNDALDRLERSLP